MLTAPESIMRLLEPFRPVFSERVWGWALELLLGAILAPGRRTVTRILPSATVVRHLRDRGDLVRLVGRPDLSQQQMRAPHPCANQMQRRLPPQGFPRPPEYLPVPSP